MILKKIKNIKRKEVTKEVKRKYSAARESGWYSQNISEEESQKIMYEINGCYDNYLALGIKI